MEKETEEHSEINYEKEVIKIEKKIAEYLTKNLISVLYTILQKQGNDNKKYFNTKQIELLEKTFQWTINLNTVKANRGDFSTNSLLKVYHLIFDVDIEELKIDKDSYDKLKKEFLSEFEPQFLSALNDIEKNEDGIFMKFEIKNGYINVYLNDKYQEVVSHFKKFQKKREFDKEYKKFTFESIGKLVCCFPEKFSVPRQGNLLELTRGKIVIDKSIDMASFDGIENFTYLWIVYVFHLHQNFAGSKISPPKYEEGKKLGVFATRTPHRPNPIGLTLCKFDRIEGNEIYISCIDMVDGTPILDIKPYHHLESINVLQEGIQYPDWIKNAGTEIKAKVEILPEAEKNLDDILANHKLMFYTKKEELLPLIKGVLEINPHSKYMRKKKETLLYAFHLDKLNIIYKYNAETSEIVVHEIEFSEEYKKLRNKEWMEEYSQRLKNEEEK